MNKLLFTGLLSLLTFSLCAIKPLKEYRLYPQELGLIYKQLNVVTKDNYKIETWFFPAQNYPDDGVSQKNMFEYKLLDNKRRPTIIICNGDAGNMSYFQMYLAMEYTSKGFNVVTFDWRGFGNSGDFQMNTNYFCYTEMLWDYNAVISIITQQKEVDKSNVFLCGWSTGGYLSIITAYTNSNIAGTFVRGVPTTFEDIIPIIKKLLNKTDDNLIVPPDFPTHLMPLAVAPKFTKPLMLIVGSKDDRTPPWMHEKILNALPKHTYKRLMIVDGAEHGGNKAPECIDLRRFISETVEFISNVMEGK